MASSLDIIIQAQDKASETFRKVGEASDGLGSKLKAMGEAALAAAAAYVSWNAIEGAIKKTEELGEATYKLQMQTGLTAHDASAMIAVFEHVGLGADVAERGLGIMAKSMENAAFAAQHGKDTVNPFTEAMTALGVKFLDASNHVRNANGVFLDIADRFAKIKDSGEKSALAMDLFGKSGKDLLPVLNLGREGILAVEAEADKLHITLTQKNVTAIHNYVEAQRSMNEAIGGLKLQLGEAIMPALTAFANIITNLIPIIGKFVDEAIDKLSFLAPAFEAVKAQAQAQLSGIFGVVKAVVDGIEKAADLISDIASGNWASAWQDIKDIAVDIGKAMVNSLAAMFGEIPNLLISAMNKAISAIDSVKLPKSIFGIDIPGGGGGLGIPELPKINTDLFTFNDALSKIAPLAKSAHDSIDTSGLNQALADIPPKAGPAAKATKDLSAAHDTVSAAAKSATPAVTALANAVDTMATAVVNAGNVGIDYAFGPNGSVIKLNNGQWPGGSTSGGGGGGSSGGGSVAGTSKGGGSVAGFVSGGGSGGGGGVGGGAIGHAPAGGAGTWVYSSAYGWNNYTDPGSLAGMTYRADLGGYVPNGGGRAMGGPVRSGIAYTVGENGPETFVPGQSGSIVPNGGITINVNVAGSINGVDDVKRVIREAILGGGFRGVLT